MGYDGVGWLNNPVLSVEDVVVGRGRMAEQSSLG